MERKRILIATTRPNSTDASVRVCNPGRWFALFLLIGWLSVNVVNAQLPEVTVLTDGHPTSIRGVSVWNDSIAWVSGSNGWIGRTDDRGSTWDWCQVIGHQDTDFRDIEAFSAEEAIILSAGSPLVILRTSDGGKNWTEVYRDERPEVFFDGMDFWDNRRGIAYGDPIGGLMQLLITDDGGCTWRDVTQAANMTLADGEAGFAASGTGIRALRGGHIRIATGGRISRLIHGTRYGRRWRTYPCPILQGRASTGIFSIAFLDKQYGVAVGGDYQQDTLRRDAVYLTVDGGRTWQAPVEGTSGYRSAVEYIDRYNLIAVGTSGGDYSADGGHTWQRFTDEGYHAVRKAKQGSWIIAAGSQGKIAEIWIAPSRKPKKI